MADDKGWFQRAVDWVKSNHEQQPSLGAEIRAMGREAIKDVRNTVHETFFGQPEHQGEPGAPLNPTMQETTKDRGLMGHGIDARLDTINGQYTPSQGQDRSPEIER